MTTSHNPYRGFRFPAEIIQHAVWLYHCFSGCVRSRASGSADCRFGTVQDVMSRCFEDREDGDGAAEVAQSSAIGGNVLAMEGSDAQETP
jgi:hypothetical protein